MNIRIGVLTAAFVLGISLPSWAAIEVGDQFKMTKPYSISSQGPFLMTEKVLSGDTQVAPFETFCVEVNEYFHIGNTYSVAGIGVQTIHTGNYLSPYTAWVYTKYSTDTTFHDYVVDHEKFNLVQKAIWAGMVQNVGDAPGSAGSEYAKYTSTPFASIQTSLGNIGISLADFASSGWSGFGDVKVLNMVGPVPSTKDSQDQLAIIPSEGTPQVPEPMSVIVWSLLGLCFVGTAIWRRRK
jgi:hypothetical protein